MSFATMPITYGLPSRSSLFTGLLLEQAPYNPGLGIVTRLDLVSALSEALFDTESNEIDCGVDDDGSFEAGLYVYPYQVGMAFQVGLTNGSLSAATYSDVEVRERIDFSLETEARLHYPARSIKSYEWLDNTWGSEGEVTSSSLSVDGQTIISSAPVYGTVEVVYITSRYAYKMTITPRPDAVENVYESVAWARYDGGCEMLSIDEPPGAESNYLEQTDCLGGGLKVTPSPDYFRPPDGYPVNKDIRIDYCSQCKYLSSLIYASGRWSRRTVLNCPESPCVTPDGSSGEVVYKRYDCPAKQ